MVLNRRNISLAATLLLQILLCYITFRKVLRLDSAFLWADWGDGLKNYFTFHSYITSPVQGSFFLYPTMNYPFGDYVFYTDNTPFLSVPLRWLVQQGIDLSPYLFFIHHLYFVAGVVVASYFLHKILSLFLKNDIYIAVLAVGLVWINPQMLRFDGHFNLSLSCFLLANIYYCLQIYRQYSKSINEPPSTPHIFNRYTAYLFLLTIIASFHHIYYLLIIGINTTTFAFVWAVTHHRQWRSSIRAITGLLAAYGAGFVIVFATLRSIDTYYNLRRVAADGYDWGPWKNSFSSIFSHYEWSAFKFFLSSNTYIGLESRLYLGTFALYGGCFLALMWAIGKIDKAVWQRTWQQQTALCLLVGAGFIAFIISIGEITPFFNNEYKFINYFNPLMYLRKITARIEQFRCLGRFGWLFFWSINIGIAYALERYCIRPQHPKRLAILGLLVLMLVFDARDFINKQKRAVKPNQLLEQNIEPELKQLFSTIDPSRYQAILSVPPYHVGCEDYSITFDPPESFFTQNLQLQGTTKLPLVGCKLSRTPLPHAQTYISIFQSPEPPQAWLEQLPNKLPILVFAQKEYDKNENIVPDKEPARSVYLNASQFLTRPHLQLLGESGNYQLYEWQIATP